MVLMPNLVRKLGSCPAMPRGLSGKCNGPKCEWWISVIEKVTKDNYIDNGACAVYEIAMFLSRGRGDSG